MQGIIGSGELDRDLVLSRQTVAFSGTIHMKMMVESSLMLMI